MAGTIRVAAQDRLLAQGAAPDLYLVHTVQKGETWYSLGRAYGLSPKDIAAKNKLSMDQGLSLGKQITIPLNKNNFLQTKSATGRPVYHHIGDKETLYRISVKYDKVPIDNIRSWNHFTGDGVQKDAYLVVGYVKGSANSVLPSSTASTPAPAAPAPAKTAPVIASTPPPAPAPTPAPAPVEETPVVTTPPPPPPAPVETKPAPVVTETKPVEPPVTSSVGRVPVVPDGGFEQIYDDQTNGGRDVTKEKGPGTWFRSNAIVGSGKYYALHNTAPRGTIVKVTNPLTGKSIYAKVLDAIPQLKANANLIIKLSDAAQGALGITEPRFYCELTYEEK